MFKFECNMSSIDRTARIVIGSSLLTLGPLTDILKTDTMSNIILGVLGTTAVLSGIFAYCFLYEITGFNTLSNSQDADSE